MCWRHLMASTGKVLIYYGFSIFYQYSFFTCRPLISAKEAESLGTILSKHLPILAPTKTYVPWKQLRNVPKSERKLFRQKYAENQNNSDKTEVGSR